MPPEVNTDPSSVFFWMDQFFCTFFFVELLLRFLSIKSKLKCFKDPGHLEYSHTVLQGVPQSRKLCHTRAVERCSFQQIVTHLAYNVPVEEFLPVTL